MAAARAVRTPLRSAPVLLVVLACGGDAASGPGEGLPPLVVTLATTTLASATDSLVVTAHVDGVPARQLRVTLASEQRQLTELPVLQQAALGRRVLLPAGPGSATLTVSAADARPASVTVHVAPAQPTVFTATTTRHGNGADTTTLRGARLDQLAPDAVRLGGTVATVLSRSAGTLLLRTPAGDAGCGPAAPAALTVAGGSTAPGLQLWLPRDGELALAVGAWRPLTAAEAGCVRLPAGTAEYVLAYADASVMEAARTGWAPAPWSHFTVTVRDLAAGAAATSASRAAAQLRTGESPGTTGTHPGLERVTPAAAAAVECSDDDFTNLVFWCRSRPWQVGDRLRIRRPNVGTPDTVTATVYAIHGGAFVLAAIDGDASPALAQLRAAIDSVMPAVLQHAVPLLRTTFGDRQPVTSNGSGQLLTIIGDFQHGFVASGWSEQSDGPWAVVALGSTLSAPRREIYYLLAHEFTHAWQRRWMHDSRPAGADPTAIGSHWGIEGGADLVALEAVRRFAGAAWAANRPWEEVAMEQGLDEPLARELAAYGDLAIGYHDASSFQRHLVAQLAAAGVPLDVAFREVARGAYEDWFGFASDDVQRPGLAARVRAHLGAGWEPDAAFLQYLLAQAADDLTPNAALQNPFFARVWDALGGEFRRGAGLTAAAGQAPVVAERRAMSGGVVRLRVSGTPGSFGATSSEPQVRWAIARVR